MTDDEQTDALRRWLADDLFALNVVFLFAASSLAIALTTCLWHHIHPEPPSLDRNNAPSILSAALSSLRISAARSVSSTGQDQSLSPSLAPEQGDRKSVRSKERRRRGKDPFRDLLKRGKKSKALLRAIKAADHDHPPPSADTLSTSTAPGNDTASSTSRSQSPEPARGPSELDRCVPRQSIGSDDGGVGNTARNTSSTSAVISSGDTSDGGSSDVYSWADAIPPHAVPPDSMTSADTQVNASSASTVAEHAPADAPSSPPVSTACADTHTPQSCNSQPVPTSRSCANLVRARTRLRLSRIEPNTKSPRLSFTPSTLSDSVATPFPLIHTSAPCPSSSIIQPTHSTGGAGPSTPTNSRGPTPPLQSSSPPEDHAHGERNTLPLDQCTANTQLASMHGALEAARLREEQLRVEAEQASKERDEVCWKWNEDAGLWRRKEAELQAQIHHLMQQLQAYAAVASFQAQQVSNSGFSSPASPHAHSSPLLQHHPLVSFPLPPAIQTQNSASAPAHVQALLASAPMLTSHPPGFGALASACSYSGVDLGMSPLLRSGLGLCVPKRDQRHDGRLTPDSSASGSSSRGRQRRRCAENAKNASDESSLGDWDGAEDGSADEDPWDEEEEDDIFRNNALADAILKRPESIRRLGSSVGKRSAPSGGRPRMRGMSEVGRGGAGEREDGGI